MVLKHVLTPLVCIHMEHRNAHRKRTGNSNKYGHISTEMLYYRNTEFVTPSRGTIIQHVTDVKTAVFCWLQYIVKVKRACRMDSVNIPLTLQASFLEVQYDSFTEFWEKCELWWVYRVGEYFMTERCETRKKCKIFHDVGNWNEVQNTKFFPLNWGLISYVKSKALFQLFKNWKCCFKQTLKFGIHVCTSYFKKLTRISNTFSSGLRAQWGDEKQSNGWCVWRLLRTSVSSACIPFQPPLIYAYL